MVLLQKWPFFNLFFLGNIGKAMSFTILQNEKTSFQSIKTRSSKSGKIDIFPKGLTHGFGLKMAIFFKLLFFTRYRPGKCFYDILERENAFLGFINKKLKSRSIDIFSKGLTHGFGRKIAIFLNSFFQAIQARKMSFTIFQNEKTPFQAIKTTSSKVEKLTFFQRGYKPMVLVQKWPFFKFLFFWQYRQEKCILRYSRRKKRLSRL